LQLCTWWIHYISNGGGQVVEMVCQCE
jgi:hypothetical protein